jgi:hypothetical protein
MRVNISRHDKAITGEKLADSIASGIGSWRLLIGQTFAVLCWVSLNIVGLVGHRDPFPSSCRTSYSAPGLRRPGRCCRSPATLKHRRTS